MKKIGLILMILLVFNFCFANPWWGSVFVDKNTGIAGGGTNYETNAIANKEAKISCIEKHQKKGLKHNCEYLTSFSNACIAVYWAPTKKRLGWSTSLFDNDVKAPAYNSCIEFSGEKCQLILSFCTDRVIY